jgi:peptidoglycan/LPS O-acetylase OafA/YrhL
MTAKPENARFQELDALRGLAALAVVGFHYSCNFVEVHAGSITNTSGIWWGRFGVQLFFAISGFVIFMTLEKTREPFAFIISRFSRLFPAYWAAMIVTSIILLLWGDPRIAPTATAFAANFTMVPAMLGQYWIDGSYWSLEVELQFYLFMYVLCRFDQFGRIELWLALWMGLGLSITLVTHPTGPFLWNQINWFAIGIAAYRVWTGARTWRQQAFLILPVAILAFASDSAANSLMVAVAGLIVLIMGLLVEGRLRWLRHPLLLWLGAISYPLYLIHQYAGYTLMAKLTAVGMSQFAASLTALAAALAVGWLLHKLVEKPAMLAIRSAGKARQQRVAAPVHG